MRKALSIVLVVPFSKPPRHHVGGVRTLELVALKRHSAISPYPV
jgi:hypothetical protein